MKTSTDASDEKIEPTPFGKVMGIVMNREQLHIVSQALMNLGASNVEAFDGTLGMDAMSGEQHAVAQCFLGDMEAKTVQRVQAAINCGKIIFAVAVEPEQADAIAEAAKAQGATEVVHFGTWVITNY